MKIRKNIARLFLFIATVYWGIWLGGYIFNAVMVVPGWSYRPPESISNYIKESHPLLSFFSAVNPWALLMSLIAWLLTIKIDTGARVWIGRATLIALIMLPLKIWMVFTIGGIFKAARENNFEPNMVNTIKMWSNLNWLTIVIATIVLVLHLLAILHFNNPRQTKK
jgi:hypothetical protein